MKSVTIKKGELESPSETLAHLTLSAAVLPQSNPLIVISVLGSIDNENFYPIYCQDGKKLTFSPESSEGCFWTFDPIVFDGPQFIKFRINSPLTKDYKIFLNENSPR